MKNSVASELFKLIGKFFLSTVLICALAYLIYYLIPSAALKNVLTVIAALCIIYLSGETNAKLRKLLANRKRDGL